MDSQELLAFVVNGVLQGSVYALMALGYTMVYGVLRLVNFAHSEVYMVGAFVGYVLLTHLQAPLGLAVLGAMLASGVLAALIERLVYRRLRGASRLSALITSLGVSLVLQNVMQQVAGPHSTSFPAAAGEGGTELGELFVTHAQMAVVIATGIVMLGAWLFVERSAWGRAVRATRLNPDAAQLMGINTDRVASGTFFVGGAIAGLAGVLVGIYEGSIEPLMGVTPGLKAFVAAVIGGIGSIPGAVLGSLLLGLVESVYTGLHDGATRDIAAFTFLLLLLLLRPAGLLARRAVEKV